MASTKEQLEHADAELNRLMGQTPHAGAPTVGETLIGLAVYGASLRIADAIDRAADNIVHMLDQFPRS